MNTFRRAAVEILRKENAPLHYREITKKALDSGVLKTTGKTPAATMNSRIITDLNVKGSASEFFRVGPGVYILNPSKSGSVKEILSEQGGGEGQFICPDTFYVEKAGKHLVCAELLLRGLNVAMVDSNIGTNIVALEGEKSFSMQVITTCPNDLDEYAFDFSLSSKNGSRAMAMFYIFVFLNEKDKNHFLILPSHEMDRLFHEKAISESEDLKYQVMIRIRGKKMYIAAKEYQMDYYLDNWAIIS